MSYKQALRPSFDSGQDQEMAGPIKRLRAAGGAANWLATALTIAGTNWGVLVSFAAGIGAWFWKDAFGFASDPHVQIGGSVFLWTLWTYIALSILYRLHHGIRTSPMVDYAFGIIIENIGMNVDAADDGRFQVVVNVRNICAGAIKIKITDIRLIIDGRTNPDKELDALILPRLGTKGIAAHPFKKEDFKDGDMEGSLDFTIQYGPHDGDPVRQIRSRTKITIVKTPSPLPWGFSNEHVSEDDTPL